MESSAEICYESEKVVSILIECKIMLDAPKEKPEETAVAWYLLQSMVSTSVENTRLFCRRRRWKEVLITPQTCGSLTKLSSAAVSSLADGREVSDATAVAIHAEAKPQME